jgi:PIN domain nuclease of toxin-antitoxin system
MTEGAESLLLLDTHVWIWVMDGAASALSPAAVEAIEEASEEGRIRVAAISVWEVAMLAKKGRLRLSLGLDEWVERALSAPGGQLVPLTPDISIDSARLPGPSLDDPVDRLVVATARQMGATLATRDRELIGYGRSGHLSVLDATP